MALLRFTRRIKELYYNRVVYIRIRVLSKTMKQNKRLQTFMMLIPAVLISILSYAQYDNISFDGYDRTYLLHLPTGYTGETDLPLIIVMHGGFGNAYGIQAQSQLSLKANAENFIVVYPEGVEGGMFNIRTWNAGACCGFASNNNIDDVGFVNSLLNTLIEQYSIDTSRIYASGMSNGGLMAHRLACELSNRIAAIAPVASSISMTECTPDRPVSVIQFHSYLDTNIPHLGGVGTGPSGYDNPSQEDVMNLWANINNCNTTEDVIDDEQYTFTKRTNCDSDTEIHHYLTHDGGHSWPGGAKTKTGDPVSIYINAGDLMWSFLQQYSLQLSPEELIFTNGFEQNSVFTQ